MTDGAPRSVYGVGYHEHVQTLTESQRAFPFLLDEWIQQPENTKIILAGGPGSGKTYTVVSCLDYVQIPQLRMAPTARVACKIKGSTIHSALKLDWKNGSVLHTLQKELESETDTEECLKKSAILLDTIDCRSRPEIVVIDEVGMVAFWLIEWIIEYFFRKPKPVFCVVMGDPNQLKPVRSLHNIFTAGVQTMRIDLKESKRFDSDYETIVQQLRGYVDNHDETGLFTFLCSHFPVVEHIDSQILKECTRALAFLKVTVETYNEFYLKNLVKGPRLRLWRKAKQLQSNDFVDVKRGCHVFVTQNGVSRVQNGTSLIFMGYNQEKDYLECLLNGDHVEIHRNQRGEFPILVGFAGTIHKFQGDTMDDKVIAINFDGNRDLNLVYTALSRVRSKDQIKAIQL